MSLHLTARTAMHCSKACVRACSLRSPAFTQQGLRLCIASGLTTTCAASRASLLLLVYEQGDADHRDAVAEQAGRSDRVPEDQNGEAGAEHAQRIAEHLHDAGSISDAVSAPALLMSVQIMHVANIVVGICEEQRHNFNFLVDARHPQWNGERPTPSHIARART